MYAEMQRDGKGCPPRTPCDFNEFRWICCTQGRRYRRTTGESDIPEGCLVTSTPAILPVHIIPSSGSGSIARYRQVEQFNH